MWFIGEIMIERLFIVSCICCCVRAFGGVERVCADNVLTRDISINGCGCVMVAFVASDFEKRFHLLVEAFDSVLVLNMLILYETV